MWLWLAGAAAAGPRLGTTSFVLDGNRVYAELAFVRPDGGLEKGLAYVDMGGPDMALNAGLADQLRIDAAHPLSFRVGALPVSVPAAAVVRTPGAPRRLQGEPVVATLPASVLQRYQAVFDYRARRLTLAEPGTLRPQGVATPFRINPETGLIAVEAEVNGRTYPLTIDNGSAWTWARASVVQGRPRDGRRRRGRRQAGASGWQTDARGLAGRGLRGAPRAARRAPAARSRAGRRAGFGDG